MLSLEGVGSSGTTGVGSSGVTGVGSSGTTGVGSSGVTGSSGTGLSITVVTLLADFSWVLSLEAETMLVKVPTLLVLNTTNKLKYSPAYNGVFKVHDKSLFLVHKLYWSMNES